MPTKYNRRKRRKTRKRGGKFFNPNNEKLLEEKFPIETGPPTLAELDEFRKNYMQLENYSEILTFMLKRFGSLKVSTDRSRDQSALEEF
jgi:hypothetical protein